MRQTIGNLSPPVFLTGRLIIKAKTANNRIFTYIAPKLANIVKSPVNEGLVHSISDHA
jgi:hypothetical protein